MALPPITTRKVFRGNVCIRNAVFAVTAALSVSTFVVTLFKVLVMLYIASSLPNIALCYFLPQCLLTVASIILSCFLYCKSSNYIVSKVFPQIDNARMPSKSQWYLDMYDAIIEKFKPIANLAIESRIGSYVNRDINNSTCSIDINDGNQPPSNEYQFFIGAYHIACNVEVKNTRMFLVPPGFNETNFASLVDFVNNHLHYDQLNKSQLEDFQRLLLVGQDSDAQINTIRAFHQESSLIVDNYTDRFDAPQKEFTGISKFFARMNVYGVEKTFNLLKSCIDNNENSVIQNLIQMGFAVGDFTENDLQEIVFMIELAKDVSTHQNKLELPTYDDIKDPHTQWQALLSCAYLVKYIKSRELIPSLKEHITLNDNKMLDNCFVYYAGFQVNIDQLSEDMRKKLLQKCTQHIVNILLQLNNAGYTHLIIAASGYSNPLHDAMCNQRIQLIVDAIRNIKSTGVEFNLVIILKDHSYERGIIMREDKVCISNNICLFDCEKNVFSLYNHLSSISNTKCAMMIEAHLTTACGDDFGRSLSHNFAPHEALLAQIIRGGKLCTLFNKSLLKRIQQMLTDGNASLK